VSDVEKIKERLGIVDVVRSYIPVEKAGASYKAKCPFHNEKTASFNISPERNVYYCFGCGARGDIFTFVEEFEGLDFAGALTFLADKAGVQLSGVSKKDTSLQESLYRVMEEALLYYEKEYTSSPEASLYLQERGVGEATIASFRIGFAPDGWRHLYDFLSKKGFSDSLLEKAGLIKASEKKENETSRFYDRFRNRIMFPIMDSAGRVIAFSGRTLEKRDDVAKYINSPETELFNKSDVLYGYDKAKTHIRNANACILVEGQVDLLMAHQAGFPYTVASSGTSFTGSHLARIKRMTDTLIIAFDRDRAGLLSTKKTALMALGVGMNVKVALLPEGKDPALMIQEDKEGWIHLVKTAPHVIEVFLREITKKYTDKREYWQHIKKHILPLISVVPDAIDRSFFVDETQKVSGIPKYSIEDELKKVVLPKEGIVDEEEKGPIKITGDKNDRTRVEAIVRMLNALYLWQKEKKDPDIDVLYLEKEIKALYKDMYSMEVEVSDIAPLLFEFEKIYTEEKERNVKHDIEELLLLFEEIMVRKELQELTEKVADAERNGEKELLQDYMHTHQEYSQRLQEIINAIKSRT